MRTALRTRRDAFVAALPDPRATAAQAVAWLTPLIERAQCVAGYVARGSEFPALPALERAAALGKATALPRVDSRRDRLRFLAWAPGDPLEHGYFGLEQPRDSAPLIPDLVLAPLLGFDRALQRLGQGAGFYDAWFAANPAGRRVGLAWTVQEVPDLPVDTWDVPLHAVVTQSERIDP